MVIFSDGKTGLLGLFLRIIFIILIIVALFFTVLGFYYDKDYEDLLAMTKDMESKNLYISKKIKNLQPNFRNFLSDNLSGNYGKLLQYNGNTNSQNGNVISKLSLDNLVNYSDSAVKCFDLIAKNALTSKSIWYNYPLCLPISVSEKYVISRPFSDSLPDPFTGEIKKHNGIDIAAVNGSVPVLLPADGEVLLVKEDVFFGKMIRIKHFGGYETFYAHLGSVSVKQGQKLKRGAQIGYFGESGWTTHPHLHYELIKNGENVDPQLYNFNSLYD